MTLRTKLVVHAVLAAVVLGATAYSAGTYFAPTGYLTVVACVVGVGALSWVASGGYSKALGQRSRWVGYLPGALFLASLFARRVIGEASLLVLQLFLVFWSGGVVLGGILTRMNAMWQRR
jgi:hypothetical protein